MLAYVEQILGKTPKKNDLMDVLTPVMARWDMIGVQLEVDDDVIDGLRTSPAANNTKLDTILTEWMNNTQPPVTWDTIIAVIESNPIRNRRVAGQIREFLRRPDIIQKYLKQS